MKILVIFYLLLWSALSNAQEEASNSLKMPDWLGPEDSVYSINNFSPSYDAAVAKLLLPQLEQSEDIRAIILPSFSPEWGMSINSDTGKVIVAIAAKQIGSSSGETKVAVNTKKLILPVDTAKRLARLVNLHLARVQYPLRNMNGFDGATYHFSGVDRENGIIRAGSAWSPEFGTPISRLVEVVWLLRSMAEKKNERETLMDELGSSMEIMEKDFFAEMP